MHNVLLKCPASTRDEQVAAFFVARMPSCQRAYVTEFRVDFSRCN